MACCQDGTLGRNIRQSHINPCFIHICGCTWWGVPSRLHCALELRQPKYYYLFLPVLAAVLFACNCWLSGMIGLGVMTLSLIHIWTPIIRRRCTSVPQMICSSSSATFLRRRRGRSSSRTQTAVSYPHLDVYKRQSWRSPASRFMRFPPRTGRVRWRKSTAL